MIRANYHTHTVMCDGANTPEEMVQAAIAAGFTQLGFSGHMDPDIHMDWAAYTAEIGRLKAAYADKIDIIMGVELDTLYDPALCPGAEYVIGSTHFLDVETEVPMSVDNTPEILEELCRRFFGGDWMALTRSYFQLEAMTYERTGCTFVGHFDLVSKFNGDGLGGWRYFDETSREYLGPALEAMEALVEQGLPFEINGQMVARGLRAVSYPRPELLQALHDMGGKILISADAHKAELITGGFATSVRQATECGFATALELYHDGTGAVQMREVPLGDWRDYADR